MKQRLAQVKKATVRILVNGQPSGSGFIISGDGLVATCFHVVQQLLPVSNEQTQVTYATSIEVEFNDGQKLPATVRGSCQDQGFLEALSKDCCVLEVESKDLVPLPLGMFADVYEGDDIYLCGFPFGINQPVVSVGMLSAKWITAGYLNQGSNREVAWLDVTMNRGNSGGPVVLVGNEPQDDKVIGIASFGLNPFANSAEEFIQVVKTFPGRVEIMGVDFKKFATLIGTALASNSLGVGGCISIDYLKAKLEE
jgi:serine protease Do